MKAVPNINDDATPDVVQMPGWVTTPAEDAAEDAAFLSGAALCAMHHIAQGEMPAHALWRDRLALGAAEAGVALAGRMDRAADLRDAVHLLRPGDDPGPAGAIYQLWRRAVARPATISGLQRVIPDAVDLSKIMTQGRQGPVGYAATVLAAILASYPKEEVAALILADAALARAMGWRHLVPLLATRLTPADLRKTDAELRLAMHRALIGSASDALHMATDLARRAERLRAVAPKLRTKRAGEAVHLFLTHDALTPSLGLTHLMSDRAARRICDRLVSLGVVRELSGRDTFRLYGL